MNDHLPKRKPLRLPSCDYNTPGAYFITMCTHNRENILSKIICIPQQRSLSKLTNKGEIVEAVIKSLPDRYGASISKYVIMPNHVHLIIVIKDRRAHRDVPLQGRSVISKIVGYIKMNSTKKIHENISKGIVWQRQFHDHIIRDIDDYINIAKYIEHNPDLWYKDCFNNIQINNIQNESGTS